MRKEIPPLEPNGVSTRNMWWSHNNDTVANTLRVSQTCYCLKLLPRAFMSRWKLRKLKDQGALYWNLLKVKRDQIKVKSIMQTC